MKTWQKGRGLEQEQEQQTRISYLCSWVLTRVPLCFAAVFQIMVLAWPGVVITFLLIALCAKLVFPYQWSWNKAFLFGAMLSATDPVAVVAVLQEVRGRRGGERGGSECGTEEGGGRGEEKGGEGRKRGTAGSGKRGRDREGRLRKGWDATRG
jgi:membrane protein implicated in regulation of membrane protease activity